MKPIFLTKPASFSALKSEAQKVFNSAMVRKDKDEPCIYCGYRSFGKGPLAPEACHFLPVSTAEVLRYEEDNCHKGHHGCNVDDNREAYRANLILKIGLDRVLDLESRQHSLAKFSRIEVENIIQKYK